MGENSKIEWCDHTFNPWIGCTEVSPACDHCYARTMMQDRYKRAEWGDHPRVRTSDNNWRQPIRWNAEAERTGVRRKVFCASLADVFDNQVDPDWLLDLWWMIGHTPHLDWLLLTKRPQNIRGMLPDLGEGPEWPWPNVWLGTTVENQEEAERRIPHLLAVRAKVRFLSCEPLLGPIDLARLHGSTADGLEHWWESCLSGKRFDPWSDGDVATTRIDWVIAGGESGPSARPSHPDWFRSLRDQCATAGVPFFFKQWGEWSPVGSGYYSIVDVGFGAASYRMIRVGKARSGAMLDGRPHKEFPA